MKGEKHHESIAFGYYYDDGDVYVDLLHMYDLLRLSFRCTLHFKNKPLCHLNFGGITIVYNRETLSESPGLFFYKAGNQQWKTILKSSSGQISVSVECVAVITVHTGSYTTHPITKGNHDYV